MNVTPIEKSGKDSSNQHSLIATPTQARQTRQQFATSNQYLSFELGKAVKGLPASYTRLLAATISLAVIGTLTWAGLSKQEQVANAQGKTIPLQQVQPIRAKVSGDIQTIAKENQYVKKGDVLLKINSEHLYDDLRNLNQQIRGINANIQRIRNNAAQGQNNLKKEIHAQLKGLNQQLDLVNNELLLHPFPQDPKAGYLLSSWTRKVLKEKASVESDIAAKKQQLYQISNQDYGSKSGSLAQINQLEQERIKLEGQRAQIQYQIDNSVLKAPVSGTVFNVKATQGQANVQTGDELLTLSPEGMPLVMKVTFDSKDAPLIRPGMKAKVKLAAFDFQKTGILAGTVKEVSPDSVEREGEEPRYQAIIELEKTEVRIGERSHPLKAGMGGKAEVITGEKTVLGLLVEPIAKTVEDSLK